MTCGSDISKGGMTAVRLGEAAQMAFLLNGWTSGSFPYQDVKPVQLAQSITTEALERVGSHLLRENPSDMRYAYAKLQTGLAKASNTIAEMSSLLGVGLYVSGTIVYEAPSAILILAFGGAAVYRLEGGGLTHLVGGYHDGLITNALGSGGKPAEAITLTRPMPSRLLSVPCPLERGVLQKCAEILEQADEAHPDTAAMMISQAALYRNAGPVMDCSIAAEAAS